MGALPGAASATSVDGGDEGGGQTASEDGGEDGGEAFDCAVAALKDWESKPGAADECVSMRTLPTAAGAEAEARLTLADRPAGPENRAAN